MIVQLFDPFLGLPRVWGAGPTVAAAKRQAALSLEGYLVRRVDLAVPGWKHHVAEGTPSKANAEANDVTWRMTFKPSQESPFPVWTYQLTRAARNRAMMAPQEEAYNWSPTRHQ